MTPRRRPGFLILALGLALATGLGATQACAQAVERNLPRSEARPDVKVEAPAPKREEDATPIGPGLVALITIGGADAVEPASSTAKGVDLHRLERLDGTDQRFRKFLGRPISQKLISDIGAEILAVYRLQGHPLINISTPPQDITDGVLRIRVFEFDLGEVKTAGTNPGEGRYIAKRVQLEPGKPINTNVLTEDLDWLNRYAFRQVSVAFSPSKTQGQADVTLQATSTKPWRVSAGYANSGSPLTSEDRWFVGAQARVPGLSDAVVSYQGTVSGDALQNGDLFSSDSTLRYRSHGLSLLVPTLPRQSVELTLNDIKTNQPFEAFVANSAIQEASLIYRSALSGIGLSLPGDVALGLEARRSISKINFDGVTVNEARFDVFQALVGYTWRGNSPLGATQLVTALHVSPGDINDYNTDVAFGAYSANRFAKAGYAYATAGVMSVSPAFSAVGVEGLQVYSSLTAQYAAEALPTTEQMGLGGAASVRGYTLDDGAFDAGAVVRTELRHDTTSLALEQDVLTTSLFLDLGYGRSNLDKADATAASIGAGVNYRIDQRFTLSVEAGVPLKDLGNTKAGSARIQAWLSAVF